MADPVLESGFPTFLTFSLVPAIPLEEKSVKPPGWDQGGETDVSTMRAPRDANGKAIRTYAAKALMRLTNCTVTWTYKASIYAAANMRAVVGRNQLITMTLPNLATVAFWGFIDKAEPSENSMDENQPTLEGTLVLTNRNDSGVVTEMAYVAAP